MGDYRIWPQNHKSLPHSAAMKISLYRVCLYFKESLPIVNRPDLVLTDETIISAIRLGRNKIFHVLSNRTPSMTAVGGVAAYCSDLKDSFDKIAREKPSLVILPFYAVLTVTWGS